MKKTEKLFFLILFIILAAIWLLVLWPEVKPPVQPTITPSYTSVPAVTNTITPTQTYNPTSTTVISPTLTVAVLTDTPTPIIWTLTPTTELTQYPTQSSIGYRCDWWRADLPQYYCWADPSSKVCYWKWCN